MLTTGNLPALVINDNVEDSARQNIVDNFKVLSCVHAMTKNLSKANCALLTEANMTQLLAVFKSLQKKRDRRLSLKRNSSGTSVMHSDG